MSFGIWNVNQCLFTLKKIIFLTKKKCLFNSFSPNLYFYYDMYRVEYGVFLIMKWYKDI